MTGLALRCRDDEQMDAADLDEETYACVLHDLARINRWTFTAHPLLAFLDRATFGLTHFRLLDVGFGEGDLLRRVAGWAHRRGIATSLIGIDINPRSADIARAATPPDLSIQYLTGDCHSLFGTFDFIVSSQVTHHMTDRQLFDFLNFMELRAERGWLINDLHRHAFAYHGFPLLARLLGVHRIVREDGQLSIARSFRADEWRAILSASGLPMGGIKIVRRFPFRLAVERLKQRSTRPHWQASVGAAVLRRERSGSSSI
jgi:2-polyprenyl-3-methyl-5-hydroxy-6-metoxy-1,4-benzoquinol methylase